MTATLTYQDSLAEQAAPIRRQLEKDLQVLNRSEEIFGDLTDNQAYERHEVDSLLALCNACLIHATDDSPVDDGAFGYTPSAKDRGCTCEEDDR
jgi:hypothetical protein